MPYSQSQKIIKSIYTAQLFILNFFKDDSSHSSSMASSSSSVLFQTVHAIYL